MAARNGQTDEAVQDPSELKQKRRINAIFDARQEVIKRRRRALDMQAEGVIEEQMAAMMLREAVETYIMEVENRIWDTEGGGFQNGTVDPEDSAWYWQEAYLGKLVMDEVGETKHYNGLQSILNERNPIVQEFTVENEDLLSGGSAEVYQVEYQIPKDALMNAFRVCNAFIFQEIGMDVDLQEELPTWGFEEVEREEEAVEA